MRYSIQNPLMKSLFGKICWEVRALNTVQPLVVNCGRGGYTGRSYVIRLLLLPSKNTDFTQAAVGREVLPTTGWFYLLCYLPSNPDSCISGNFTMSPH